MSPDNLHTVRSPQMLRKAGWREGSGLGAQEQGRQQPILPEHQSGKRGLGAASQLTAQAAPEGLKAAAAAKPAQVRRIARQSFELAEERHEMCRNIMVQESLTYPDAHKHRHS